MTVFYSLVLTKYIQPTNYKSPKNKPHKYSSNKWYLWLHPR